MHIKLQIPQSFNPNIFQYPHNRWKNKAIWLVSTIYRLQLKRKQKKGSYIPLYSVFLRNILTSRDAKPLITWMIQNKIIECDYKYSVKDSKSLGYRLHPQYCCKDSIYYKVYGKRIYKSLTKWKYFVKSPKYNDPVLQYLNDNDKLLDIDIEPWDADDPISQSRIEQIKDKAHATSVGKTGRFYATFFSLKRQYRKNLKVFNQKLKSWDISNCHFIFLHQLLLNYHEEWSLLLDIYNKGQYNSRISSIGICGDISCHYGSLWEELNLLKKLAESGQIYSNFLKNCSKWQSCIQKAKTKLAREKLLSCFKQKILHVLYRYPSKQEELVYQTWVKTFPNLIKLIDGYKYRYGHRKLSYLIQIQESDLVIQHVVKRIMVEDPNFNVKDSPKRWVLTLHDAIFFLYNDDENYIKNIIEEEFNKIGYNVHLKIWRARQCDEDP